MVIDSEWAEEKFLSQDSNSRFFLEYNSESPIHSYFFFKAKNEKKNLLMGWQKWNFHTSQNLMPLA